MTCVSGLAGVMASLKEEDVSEKGIGRGCSVPDSVLSAQSG